MAGQREGPLSDRTQGLCLEWLLALSQDWHSTWNSHQSQRLLSFWPLQSGLMGALWGKACGVPSPWEEALPQAEGKKYQLT